MNRRLDWVDYGKGLGIILVVYGHALSSAYHSGLNVPGHFFVLSDSVVYSFHMPLFFFLSGLFVEHSFNKRGAKRFLADKLGSIAYPYVIWSVLQMSVEFIFSSHTQRAVRFSDILAIPYRPWEQFWFLYALFLMYVVYTLLNRTGKYSTFTIAGLAGILLLFPLPTSLFVLHGFSEHFIFFAAGILLARYLINGEQPNPSIWMGILFLVTFVAAAYFTFEWQISPQRLPVGRHPFYFLLLAGLGTAAVIYISQYLASRNAFSFLKILGVYSLQIYLAHMFAVVGVRVVLHHVFKTENWIINLVIGLVLGLLTPILLVKITEKLHTPYMFTIKRSPTPIAAAK